MQASPGQKAHMNLVMQGATAAGGQNAVVTGSSPRERLRPVQTACQAAQPPLKAVGACRSASTQKLGMIHARTALKQAPFPPLENPVCLDAAHHQILNLNLKLELSRCIECKVQQKLDPPDLSGDWKLK